MPLQELQRLEVLDKFYTGNYYIAISPYEAQTGQELVVIDKVGGIESSYQVLEPAIVKCGRFLITTDVGEDCKEGGFAYIENDKHYISYTALSIVGPFH